MYGELGNAQKQTAMATTTDLKTSKTHNQDRQEVLSPKHNMISQVVTPVPGDNLSTGNNKHKK